MLESGSFKRKDESKAMPSHDLKVRGSWVLREGEEEDDSAWRAGDVIIVATRLILRSTRTGTSYFMPSTQRHSRQDFASSVPYRTRSIHQGVVEERVASPFSSEPGGSDEQRLVEQQCPVGN